MRGCFTGAGTSSISQRLLGSGLVPQQSPEEALQQDGQESKDGHEDENRKFTVLSYLDNSFEQDLSFIDGLVKARFFSLSLSDGPSQLAVGKALNKYMIVLWSIEAYPDLINGISPEEIFQIKKFVEEKLYSFAKEEDTPFSPDIFIKTLRKHSEVGMSESEFAERDHTVPPFKVKVVKDEEFVPRRKKIINSLISEVKLSIQVTGE